MTEPLTVGAIGTLIIVTGGAIGAYVRERRKNNNNNSDSKKRVDTCVFHDGFVQDVRNMNNAVQVTRESVIRMEEQQKAIYDRLFVARGDKSVSG